MYSTRGLIGGLTLAGGALRVRSRSPLLGAARATPLATATNTARTIQVFACVFAGTLARRHAERLANGRKLSMRDASIPYSRAGCARSMNPARSPPEIARAYVAPYDTPDNRIATLRFVQDIPLAPGDPGFDILAETEVALEEFAGILGEQEDGEAAPANGAEDAAE